MSNILGSGPENVKPGPDGGVRLSHRGYFEVATKTPSQSGPGGSFS